MDINLSNLLLNQNAVLKDVLIQMTINKKGIAFICNQENKLLGIISDGDIRRALISDVSLNSPVEKVMNLNPVTASSPDKARNILEDRPSLICVPVINDQGVIKEVVFLQGSLSIDQEFDKSSRTKIKMVAIIPARGGSKRIPKKNLAKIGNKSLLGRSILAAKESKHIDHILVSTDDKEILEEAKKCGVDTGWLRPDYLAEDKSKTIDVVIHAVEEFEKEKGYLPETGILLEPTAPLRTAEVVDSAIQAYNRRSDAKSLVSVSPIRHNFHPEELLKSENGLLKPYLEGRTMNNRKRSFEQEPLYVQNGLVYIFDINMLLSQKSLYGDHPLKFETPEDSYLDIDTIDDLKLAQYKMGK